MNLKAWPSSAPEEVVTPGEKVKKTPEKKTSKVKPAVSPVDKKVADTWNKVNKTISEAEIQAKQQAELNKTKQEVQQNKPTPPVSKPSVRSFSTSARSPTKVVSNLFGGIRWGASKAVDKTATVAKTNRYDKVLNLPLFTRWGNKINQAAKSVTSSTPFNAVWNVINNSGVWKLFDAIFRRKG